MRVKLCLFPDEASNNDRVKVAVENWTNQKGVMG